MQQLLITSAHHTFTNICMYVCMYSFLLDTLCKRVEIEEKQETQKT